jgi:hypothetical protein
MPDSIIGMADMAAIFSVTDALGIHRESVSVELSKEDPGSIAQGPDGVILITAPESKSMQDFSYDLEARLTDLGYTRQELEEEGEEDWL